LPTTSQARIVHGLFARQGEYWTLAYGNHLIRLGDSKGLRQIAHLLCNPGLPIHAIDLVAITDGRRELSAQPGNKETADPSIRTGPQGDFGPVLDAKAREAYRQRLRELQEELDNARQRGDEAQAMRAEEEIDALTVQLRAALGLGGRVRRPGSSGERARIAVTKSIGRALDAIDAENAELGQLLRTTISTGTFCCYEPSLRFPLNGGSREALIFLFNNPRSSRLHKLESIPQQPPCRRSRSQAPHSPEAIPKSRNFEKYSNWKWGAASRFH